MTTYYIFITGGVMSSLGKGIAAANIGALLQEYGYSIRIKKMDPYININPGKMNPYKHGEVFVMSDGTEADLDFGHYERFVGVKCSKKDSITTGQIYASVMDMEKNGMFYGSDIQVVPHITNEIKKFILDGNEGIDFVICEIGGTVGDIEGQPYIEAIRQLCNHLGKQKTILIHLTYLIYLASSGEVKTKPTQHSVRQLLSMGLTPDILFCRSEHEISDEIKNKLALYCGVKSDNVIEAQNLSNIYLAPIAYHNAGLDIQIIKHFQLFTQEKNNIANQNITTKWQPIELYIKTQTKSIKIAVIGDYIKLKDAYISLSQALIHAGFHHNIYIKIEWIDATSESLKIEQKLKNVHGIIVPGDFSNDGYEQKIKAIQFSRENCIPFLGIGIAMQFAMIESCLNIATNIKHNNDFLIKAQLFANLVNNQYDNKIIHQIAKIDKIHMHCGEYQCKIKDNTLAYKIYNHSQVTERFRHKYITNINDFSDLLFQTGIIVSGIMLKNKEIVIIERNNHPFFIAILAHPELLSRPFSPHPLFVNFIHNVLLPK